MDVRCLQLAQNHSLAGLCNDVDLRFMALKGNDVSIAMFVRHTHTVRHVCRQKESMFRAVAMLVLLCIRVVK